VFVFLLVFVDCVVFVFLDVPNDVLSTYAVSLAVFVFLDVPNDVLSTYAVVLAVFVLLVNEVAFVNDVPLLVLFVNPVAFVKEVANEVELVNPVAFVNPVLLVVLSDTVVLYDSSPSSVSYSYTVV